MGTSFSAEGFLGLSVGMVNRGRRYRKEAYKMYKNHKVVVTMTSWPKRIGNCA